MTQTTNNRRTQFARTMADAMIANAGDESAQAEISACNARANHWMRMMEDSDADAMARFEASERFNAETRMMRSWAQSS